MADQTNEAPGFEFESSELYENSPIAEASRRLVDDVERDRANRQLVYDNHIATQNGDAYLVKAGQVIRFEQMQETVQVADLLFFSPDLQYFSSEGMSVGFHGYYLNKYSPVLSNAGYMKLMAVMTADETPEDFSPIGVARHFWQHHCSPEALQLLLPDYPGNLNSCHINFHHALNRVPAIASIENEDERRAKVNLLAGKTNFQIFQRQKIYHTDDNNVRTKLLASPAGHVGMGVEFFVNMDVYVLFSTCVAANMGEEFFAPGADIDALEPLTIRVSVWETEVDPIAQPVWKDDIGAFYDRVRTGHKDISVRASQDSYG